MNLDDRAQHAGTTVSDRGRQMAPYPPGLKRRPSVAPAGAAGAVLAALLLFLAVVQGGPDEPEEIDTAAATVDAILGPILAGFVSDSGEITVLTGDPLSPVLRRLGDSAGPPVLGVGTIPEPRWLFDGRVIEYVSDLDGELQVVRVDVRTGLTTHGGDLDSLLADGGILTSPEEGPLIGRIPFMRGGAGPNVQVVEDGGEVQWRVSSFDDGGNLTFGIGSLRFVAPTPEGIIVVREGQLGLVDQHGEVGSLDIDGVSGDSLRSAAAGPRAELAFGLSDGSVMLPTPEGTRAFTLGTDPVTGLSWDPSGEILIAETTGSDGTQMLRLCSIGSGRCDRVQLGAATSGSLVRGVPTPLPPQFFLGFWPESTQQEADIAVAGDQVEPWRLDPQFLVTEFAKVMLGWPDPLVSRVDASGAFFELPHEARFGVRPSSQGPEITVSAAQMAGAVGWVITNTTSPSLLLSYGFSAGGPITIGFDRKGAATVDVTIGVGSAEYFQSTTDLDEVEFLVEETEVPPSYFLLLFKDEDGEVFAANSGSFDGPIPPLALG